MADVYQSMRSIDDQEVENSVAGKVLMTRFYLLKNEK